MKTVIEMALKAGFLSRDNSSAMYSESDFDGEICMEEYAVGERLKRFAELVRADEREKYKWDVHSCGPTCTKAACVAMREAVKAEREAACDIVDYELDSNGHAEAIKIAIRARSNT